MMVWSCSFFVPYTFFSISACVRFSAFKCNPTHLQPPPGGLLHATRARLSFAARVYNLFVCDVRALWHKHIRFECSGGGSFY